MTCSARVSATTFQPSLHTGKPDVLSMSSMTALLFRILRYWEKSTDWGSSESCWTRRRASSLRFLNACSWEAVLPRSPREEEMRAKSTAFLCNLS